MTVYKITTECTVRFGWRPGATLTPCESDESNMIWVETEEWETPAGWEVAETKSGDLCLYDQAGNPAALIYYGDELQAITGDGVTRLTREVA